MKKTKTLLTWLAAISLFSFYAQAFTMSGGTYALEGSVSSGGATLSGGTYSLDLSVSNQPTGRLTGGTYSLCLGPFCGPVSSCAGQPDGTSCVGGACCAGTCAAQPSCSGCETAPLACSAGTWQCTPQPAGFDGGCGTYSICPPGQTLVSSCNILCDGVGECGTCTPTCEAAAGQGACNLKIIVSSPTAWSNFAPNQSISVNYQVINTSTSQLVTSGITTNITLANATVVVPSGAYSATIRPVSQNATASESILIQAGAAGCGSDSKTISYVVAGAQKPAAAPDFDLLLLPLLAVLALLIARKRKKL